MTPRPKCSAVQDRHPDVPTVVVALGAGSVGVPVECSSWATFQDALGALGQALTADEQLGDRSVVRSTPPCCTRPRTESPMSARSKTPHASRYHNARYKALAAELGLTVTQGSRDRLVRRRSERRACSLGPFRNAANPMDPLRQAIAPPAVQIGASHSAEWQQRSSVTVDWLSRLCLCWCLLVRVVQLVDGGLLPDQIGAGWVEEVV